MGTVASGGFSAADVGAARTRQSYRNIDGMQLTINQVSYGKVPVEAVLAGEADAVQIVATTDGRGYTGRWCECDAAGGDIFCERWTLAGRVFHGWLCESCRGIVQSG